ncbi:protein kinase domain-containing protein [sulfur-oxidizing endosymbiont of Gigantopelta aegis]|uniref:protein kinase domain-containing protein n=1 Tax=sulfur-oxidizing endosymbiont of Gigantopelta aegis TaxID=2794934 RepID=UPI0018DB3942|nr:protein kinase [sulfur-oxidizing endosymbiont of Gigantopelta aegis]
MNKISIKVIHGQLKSKEFVFEERTTCIIGRAIDNHILLPDDQAHSTISRYHCLLDINPPDICIRDFGSLNGTFVNGEKIGQREIDADLIKAKQLIYPEYDLKSGDQFKIGESVFQVSISGSENLVEKIENVSTVEVDPLDKINLLMKKADDEQPDLLAIKGFNIIKKIGKGSMGAVYLAHKKNSSSKEPSDIALKVMLPKVQSNPRTHQQFIREAKNTRLLKHDNIVRVHDVGCNDDTYFFTSEYCEAGSVSQLIRKNGGKLPLFLALKILINILDGLEYAHNIKIPMLVLADGKKTSAVGLVHRDLKPGNILLTKNKGELQAKIADFGLAKAFDVAGLSGRTATGVSAGTPFYMPRQQVINFKFAKPEVDVWAAAATFYRMSTGRYPRRYSKKTDPWLTTLKSPVSPIRTYDKSIPKALAKVIDKALLEQPDLFYKSAIDFKLDLLKVI